MPRIENSHISDMIQFVTDSQDQCEDESNMIEFVRDSDSTQDNEQEQEEEEEVESEVLEQDSVSLDQSDEKEGPLTLQMDEEDESMPSILICDPNIHQGKPQDFIDVTLNIQMEFCKGRTLREYLDNRPRLDFRKPSNLKLRREQNISIFKQLLKGVAHFHEYGIIHRDLKPSNIFIEKESDGTHEVTIKIGDFGLAVGEAETAATEDYYQSKVDKMRSFSFNVGTPLYQSPEQESNKPYNQKVDIYALGIILLEICSDFSTGHERDMMLRALKLEKQVDPQISEKFKEETDIIMKLTAHSASDRPDAKQILEGLLSWDP